MRNLCAILCAILSATVLMFATGCTETRTKKDTRTDRSGTITIRGSAVVPVPTGGIAVIPVEATVDIVEAEISKEITESKTQIDAAAIAQQVGGVVGKLMDAGIAKITGLQPSQGLTLTEGGGLAGAGTAMAWALREMLARKREEKALAEVKEARNDAQREALELAKKLPAQA